MWARLARFSRLTWAWDGRVADNDELSELVLIEAESEALVVAESGGMDGVIEEDGDDLDGVDLLEGLGEPDWVGDLDIHSETLVEGGRDLVEDHCLDTGSFDVFERADDTGRYLDVTLGSVGEVVQGPLSVGNVVGR